MDYSIRWKQRFQNFEKAYLLLNEVNNEFDNLNSLEKEGVVQRFEIVIELAWKTIKDYLENKGYGDVKNGKQAVRQAFQDGMIKDAEVWMNALEKRNLTSHTYNEDVLEELLTFISEEFYTALNDLYFYLKKKL